MRFRSRETTALAHADYSCGRCNIFKAPRVLLILLSLQVVDKDSAIIDGSHKIGFETDHRNMQRFSSQGDEDYRKILVWIRRWMEHAKEEAHSKCP